MNEFFKLQYSVTFKIKFDIYHCIDWCHLVCGQGQINCVKSNFILNLILTTTKAIIPLLFLWREDFAAKKWTVVLEIAALKGQLEVLQEEDEEYLHEACQIPCWPDFDRNHSRP